MKITWLHRQPLKNHDSTKMLNKNNNDNWKVMKHMGKLSKVIKEKYIFVTNGFCKPISHMYLYFMITLICP